MKLKLLLLFFISANFLLGQNEFLDSKLDSIKNKYNVVGMSIAIVKDGKIIYSKGFGQRDVARDLPMERDSKYRIASISKMITATALMKLYEEGKFKFEDDISDHLDFELRNPNYKDQKISIEAVVSHTAGLRDGSTYSSFLNASYSGDNIPGIENLVTSGKNYYSSTMWSSNKSPESKYFQYANVNFGIAATLIEKLSGKRFDVYCKEIIFDKMNINASFNVSDLEDINDVAAIYRKSGSSWRAQVDNFNGVKPAPRDLSKYEVGTNGLVFGPQGGLRASANDLAKLVVMYMNGGMFNGTQILNDTTIARMKKLAWSYTGSNGDNYYNIFNNYAVGNHTTSELLPGENLTGHPGEAYGLISDMYYSAEKKYGIIFLTNGGQWGYGKYSGWYNIEEDVFNLCYQSLEQLVVSASDINTGFNDFKLDQNYPNPFNPATTINYSLPGNSFVTLTVYDILGSHVKTLVNGVENGGSKKIVWDGRSSIGNKVKTGVYLYRLIAQSNTQTFSEAKRMVLLR